MKRNDSGPSKFLKKNGDGIPVVWSEPVSRPHFEIFLSSNNANSEVLLFTSFYPPSYEGEIRSLPRGFDLVGFAIRIAEDRSIESIEFTCWKSHYTPTEI